MMQCLLFFGLDFLVRKGFSITDNVVFQDNQSAMLNSGKMLSSIHTCHLDISYYFVTDQVNQKYLLCQVLPN
jgi:hypothetical protein